MENFIFCVVNNLKIDLRVFLKSHRVLSINVIVQKQPFRGVLEKRCSENMQQIYRRTPMPKYDFNKVALQLY